MCFKFPYTLWPPSWAVRVLCILRRSLRPRTPDRTGWKESGSADTDLTSHPSSGRCHASPPPPGSLFLLGPLPGHPCPGSPPCSHHLPQVSPFRRGKPASISSLHLILPGPSSQRLPGIRMAPATAPCPDSPDRQETPGGGSVSPAPRPAPKATVTGKH